MLQRPPTIQGIRDASPAHLGIAMVIEVTNEC